MSSSKLVVFIEYFLYPRDFFELVKHLLNYSSVVVVVDKSIGKYLEELELLSQLDSRVTVHVVDSVLDELLNYIDSDYVIDITFIKSRTMFTLILILLNKYLKKRRDYPRTRFIIGSLTLDNKVLKQILRFKYTKPRNRVLVSICMEYLVESEITSFAKVTKRSLYRYLRELGEQGLIKNKRGVVELTHSGLELCRIVNALMKPYQTEYMELIQSSTS